jgi:hypothetical protein
MIAGCPRSANSGVFMSTDNPQATNGNAKPTGADPKDEFGPKSLGDEFFTGLGLILLLTFIVGPIIAMIWIGKSFLVGPFPGRGAMFAMYAAFFVLFVYELHLFFVVAPRVFKKNLPKNTPKYLEYVYLVIISFGLLQIVTFPSKFSSYIFGVAGDDNTILQQIREAAGDLSKQCNSTNEYLTQNYCSKLKEIAASADLGTLLKTKFLDDYEFRTHAIGDRPVRWWAIWEGPKYDDMMIEHRVLVFSKFPELFDNYRALTEYKMYKGDETQETTLAWLGMLLLPIGIGIRMLKTSIELFAPLRQ